MLTLSSSAVVSRLFAAQLALVPRRGLEPPRLAALVPETSASTNSATWARRRIGTDAAGPCQTRFCACQTPVERPLYSTEPILYSRPSEAKRGRKRANPYDHAYSPRNPRHRVRRLGLPRPPR